MRILDYYQRQFKRSVSILPNSGVGSMLTRPAGVKLSAPMTHSRISSTQITAMLRAWGDGEQPASDELIRAVYEQLRRQARRQLRRERGNHTLDTAALINEAYLKLVEQRSTKWQGRGHFYALAAELMRRILVDHARTKHRQKRGGHDEAVDLEDAIGAAPLVSPPLNVDLIALDEALNRLALLDEQQVRVVELRYFAGLGIEETSDALDISVATVKREWAAAKAWLRHELTRRPDE
jgi:RNA polymerase sigma-70 factor (ECF subfamily)